METPLAVPAVNLFCPIKTENSGVAIFGLILDRFRRKEGKKGK